MIATQTQNTRRCYKRSTLLFETILCKDGAAQNLEYHERRMFESSGKKFDLSFLRPPISALWRCKLIYAATIISVEFTPYIKREIKSLTLIESNISYSSKFVDRKELDALFEARGAGDDTLIVKNGLITDTTIANVAFLNDNNIWLTPKTPLLKGTMRAKLLAEGFLEEADIETKNLPSFKMMAIMNALRGFEVLGAVEKVLRGGDDN